MALTESSLVKLRDFKEKDPDAAVYTIPAISYVDEAEYLCAIVGEDLALVGANALGEPDTTGVAWTIIASAEITSGSIGMRVYRGVCSATASQTTTITFPAINRNCNACIARIIDVGNIVGVTAATAAATRTSVVTIPAIGGGSMGVAFHGSESSGVWEGTVGTDWTFTNLIDRVGICGTNNLTQDATMAAAYGVADSVSDYMVTIGFEMEQGGTTSLTASPSSLLFSGVDATLGAPKNSEAANLWFNSDTWHNPTWATPWWTVIPASGRINLNAETGTFAFDGSPEATFSTVTGTTNLTCDPTSIYFTGVAATLSDQGIIITQQVQDAIDALVGDNVVDLIRRHQVGIYYNFYCVGLNPPYKGKTMWVQTVAGATPNIQALDILATMLQAGHYDPELSP